MNKIELLAPAGDFYRGKIALDYGADAIYFGGTSFSLRSRASNFDYNELIKMIEYTHSLKKKAYLVTNIYLKNENSKDVADFILSVKKLKIDGFICADPAMIEIIHELFPEAEIHISTQQSTTNSKAALFWKRNNAKRIVLAREVTYEEIVEILENTKDIIDIEYFIHGAMCISYSGQCMISNYYCSRDANTGGCAQSCRWNYSLYTDTKKYLPNFSMSCKDMSQINNLNKLMELPIKSFKVEGRMKSEYYLATIINVYSKAMKRYYCKKDIDDTLFQESLKAANRETSDGWFDGKNEYHKIIYNNDQKKVNQNYVFVIDKKISDNIYEITVKNHFTLKDKIEIFGPKHDNILSQIKSIKDSSGIQQAIINKPGYKYVVEFTEKIILEVNDFARRV